MSSLSARANTKSSGFRDLKVVAKTRESAIITSFLLEPKDARDWRPYEPGQFLVFRIPGPKEASAPNGYVLRNYSVSGSTSDVGRYRISVKREASPRPGLPDGISSTFLHDEIQVGDVLTAEGPRGDFVLDTKGNRPVVLLSGGVGLTPMVSMLHALASDDARRVIFIHACENGDIHAFRDEVSDLAALRPGITVHFCYRCPTDLDRSEGRFNSEGLVSRDLLQALLPLDDYDFYLCGPPPFMQAVYTTVRELGVPKERVAYEFFGPATVLDGGQPAIVASPAAEIEPQGTTVTVEFRRSGIKAAWDGTSSLLELAEDQGLQPEFSCRAGVCSTCKSRLIGGEVDYFEDPLDELEPGEVLLCCSRPRGSIVLDI
ncbi:2Fe-2S iron-sulfur cluster binding domain-containing protein [Mesorhizobium sp. CU2]|uniref:2Fe-2S iron-sulfur cluster-binding protein n=1 Tax=unclassified Mesorhizobium TaxID=325217 RepID=UPI001127986B|nr:MULTISPECIES: 2Fe-2S iron-sulfur cluster-binding protein [unclassified Mesorhizobium]TPN88439.1 2Fe-2S iron-sulfur cluster binding domain-containing protein [Mesorhizobium sp. CU3]TPO15586.1 2Fe-2S iron-sulfur cluster binding domain-containing protein [Mesorhizobium sp. CU2]